MFKGLNHHRSQAHHHDTIAAGLAGALSSWGKRETGTRVLLCFALPILLVFTYTSGAGGTKVHWFLLGWVFLAPLAAR